MTLVTMTICWQVPHRLAKCAIAEACDPLWGLVMPSSTTWLLCPGCHIHIVIPIRRVVCSPTKNGPNQPQPHIITTSLKTYFTINDGV